MLDDNKDFLSILYDSYDYDDYDDYYAKQCKEYNKLFSSTKKESLTDKLKKVLHLNQTQLDDNKNVFNFIAHKFVFWKNCNTLKDIALSPFDIEVFNAVCSLTIAFNEYISPGMIYRVLSGGNPSCYIGSELRDEISRSLDKLMNTSIILDDNKRCQLLSAIRAINIHFYGQPVQGCIKLHEVPAILIAARNKRELDCDNPELFKTPLSNTVENIAIKGYIFRCIKAFKNSKHKKKSFDLRLEALYAYLDISAPNSNSLRSKKLQIRKKVKKLLDYWSQSNFIKSFAEMKNDYSAITAITITI